MTTPEQARNARRALATARRAYETAQREADGVERAALTELKARLESEGFKVTWRMGSAGIIVSIAAEDAPGNVDRER